MNWDRPFSIAVLALGGQGGGVLTKWLVDIAEENDFLVQSTHVAGVAQRTGATVYCVELFPRAEVEARGKLPVFSLYPVPGSVDLVITSELAESARAIAKGFVTPNITTLVSSSHRVYTMGERIALGDGIADPDILFDTGRMAARKYIYFDMQAAADASGSVISSVILGAIAATGLLPFDRNSFAAAIHRSGRDVEANLAGFRAGFEGATAPPDGADGADDGLVSAQIRGANGKLLRQRISQELPECCHDIALHGALRALDYQDPAYANSYLDQLVECYQADQAHTGVQRGFALTCAVAPQLALQMCYEDTIRVADIKTRRDRMEGIRRDVAAQPGQPTYLTEYFRPRYEEFCDTLPAGLGGKLMGSNGVRRAMAPLFGRGRNIHTTRIAGFLLMLSLSKLRRWRRGTYRFAIQQQRTGSWLEHVCQALAEDYDYAVALANSIRIVKGYGETYERGLSRFEATLSAASRAVGAQRGVTVNQLIDAALADEQGAAFDAALANLETDL